MKNINKHREVNTHELERLSKELERKEKRQNRENYLTLVIIAIGLIGFIYVFQSSGSESGTTLNIPPHFTKQNDKVKNNRTKKINTSTTTTNQQMLVIKGHKEAEEWLNFIIDSYDEKADYKIDYGNGIIKSINDKSSFYRYPKSGHYDVKLIVSYEGKERTCKKNIFIDKAVKKPIVLKESND